jgi:CHAT domain-containing protein
VHKELLDLLLELGRRSEAFELLEGYRVGSLGTLLARRDAEAGLRAAPPALAAPRPSDLAQAARLLGEGTLLVSFAVLRERTALFALAGGAGEPSLQVHLLPVAETRLRQEIETLRDLLVSPRASAQGRAALARRLASMHDRLLGPVREQIGRSRRLLVLPDGPLHLLPFGALIVSSADRPRYLVEDLPVARAQAVTLLAAPDPPGGRPSSPLVAFGAPAVDPAPVPLPRARAEVEALGRLYAAEGRVFVGAEASEARVKALAGGARRLHFACHGLTDDRFPLDSHLALSPSADGGSREDGLLRASEICEQLTLSADVVVLSACETALGAELAGAGLLGLTYAFQLAGAHSVVASLWPVPDRSTESLRLALHERLRVGEDAPGALRWAQLELLHASRRAPAGGRWRLLPWRWGDDRPADASHPYYWAAFQLFGDRP